MASEAWSTGVRGPQVSDGFRRQRRQRPLGPNDPRNPARRGRRGLKWAEIEGLLRLQDGRCAICGTRDPGQVSWSVDHDHSCEKCGGEVGCRYCVRGLLCAGCNSMLGHAHDSPEVLREGAAYLEARAAR